MSDTTTFCYGVESTFNSQTQNFIFVKFILFLFQVSLGAETISAQLLLISPPCISVQEGFSSARELGVGGWAELLVFGSSRLSIALFLVHQRLLVELPLTRPHHIGPFSVDRCGSGPQKPVLPFLQPVPFCVAQRDSRIPPTLSRYLELLEFKNLNKI